MKKKNSGSRRTRTPYPKVPTVFKTVLAPKAHSASKKINNKASESSGLEPPSRTRLADCSDTSSVYFPNIKKPLTHRTQAALSNL